MENKTKELSKDLQLLSDMISKAETDKTAERLYGVFEATLRDIKIERMRGNWEPLDH